MKNKRPYTVLVTLMLLSSVLLTINVVAQDIRSEYISLKCHRLFRPKINKVKRRFFVEIP